ncbi:ornithine cyclodeaminase family protein [Sneathiella sp. CAU 1612]|uniref:Ornithine cyclodeaminase family protein n=1 Tax=Sneathiella sedimenti TaxID=2816034 RepID=A0ABS3F2Z7_9PROT|nr:ornithine cyclodeaminase family protein [Sneathiella sedimenti]MBO0332784.1 ornithine cyclodeaminase family protein [Sneathiella sedimenti]
MRIIENSEIAAALHYPALIDALRDMFVSGCTQPLRHHHGLDPENERKGTLLIMPAWQSGGFLGLKTVTVMPENGEKGLPSVQGTYLLFDADNGSALALMDAGELTTRRTAAASALAASYLARKDASKMLMVGAGAMAPCLIRAHAAVRDIREVTIWNHRTEKAEKLAAELTQEGFSAQAVTDLEAAARTADVISCATLSTEPLIKGNWLKPGAHLDLVGAFTPAMRESDDAAVGIASLFVDTREGGLNEAGDIVQPLKSGIIKEGDIRADLYDLCRGIHPGRESADEITLFKSTGAALEDLAAAILAYQANR